MSQLLQKAQSLSKSLHLNDRRISGETYYDHALRVTKLLEGLNVADDPTLITALLHHVLTLHPEKENLILDEFGSETLSLLKKYLKLNMVEFKEITPTEFNDELIVKTYLNLANDSRLVLIRLADKVDNISSINLLSEELKVRAAERALYLYGPISKLLGINSFARVLEDGAFKVLNPTEFAKIEKIVNEKSQELNNLMVETKHFLTEILNENNIYGEIQYRVKHIYSIYKKSLRYKNADRYVGENYEGIHDLGAMRVLVNSVEECYMAEDLLKQLWDQILEARDDYIEKPKVSGYKALHNTFNITGRMNLEFQILTKEMYEYNEFGPAGHLFYKLGNEFKRLLKENPNLLKDINFFAGSRKINFTPFSENIYVFTPKGKVIELPKGSNLIDFAYAVHEDIGNGCMGGVVNNSFVGVTHILKSGDHIEVKTAKSKIKPSEDWLNYVKTRRARYYIRKSLK